MKLARDDEDEPWRYTGPWFAIESTANPRLTRQAVVRLEQVFMSLEALLPTPEGPVKRQPNKSPTPLRVRLCGTVGEYRDIPTTLGIAAEYPACYVPDGGLLVAGSDMPALVEQERAAADSLRGQTATVSGRAYGWKKG